LVGPPPIGLLHWVSIAVFMGQNLPPPQKFLPGPGALPFRDTELTNWICMYYQA
jgi:hypothetical protein